MDERIERYLAAKEKEYYHKKKVRKDLFLIDEGLYIKEYAPTDGKNVNLAEYPFMEPARKLGDGYVHYRNTPIPLTDEEYAAVKKAYKACGGNMVKVSVRDSDPTDKPGASTALYVIGISFIILGITAGFIYGYMFADPYSDFGFGSALVIWIISVVVGVMFLGFATIIDLLNDIKNRLRK